MQGDKGRTGVSCCVRGRQVVWKSHPGERVGVVVQKDGKPCVVEYSEMDAEVGPVDKDLAA
jgi:UDP-N-acetylglucosamine pyrophosphorylase